MVKYFYDLKDDGNAKIFLEKIRQFYSNSNSYVEIYSIDQCLKLMEWIRQEEEKLKESYEIIAEFTRKYTG